MHAQAPYPHAERSPADPGGGRPSTGSTPPRPDGGLEAMLSALGSSGQRWLQLLAGEMRLSLSLCLRAAALLVLSLLLCAVAVALFGALLVALGLSFGLGWPAALALALLSLALCVVACMRLGRRLLGQSGLPASRRQLRLLLSTQAPQP